MEYTRWQKKFCLLLSRKNTVLWTHEVSQLTDTEAYHKIYGKPYSSLQSKINGQASSMRPSHLAELCERVNQAEGLESELKPGHFENDISVYEFASIFNIDRNICSQILDEYIFKNSPLLPKFYWSNEGTANTRFEQYRGLYKMYRFGTTGKHSKELLISTLSVRYIVKIGKLSTIRCKLIIPSIDFCTNKSIIEYDGFLGVINNTLNWIFEERNARDFVFMITDAGSPEEKKNLSGIYLSANQDSIPLPVSRSIYLERIHVHYDDDKMQKFMSENTSVLSKDEWFNSDTDEFSNVLNRLDQNS